MSTETMQYAGTGPSGNKYTQEGPSPALWADCPVALLQEVPHHGYYLFDDFVAFPGVSAGAESNYGNYKGFASTGGSVAASAEAGSALVFSSDGDNEGASLATETTPFSITQNAKDFWFEASIKTSTIADSKHGFFLGLLEAATLGATVPIAADGTLADQNFVGFHRLEGDGDYVDTVYKANAVTQVTVKADAQVLVADTYIKLGMTYKQGIDKSYLLTFWADGAKLADTKAIPDGTGTDFPADVTMGLVFAVLNATGTAPGNSTMRWWRAAQLW